jgi:hypothetical protein
MSEIAEAVKRPGTALILALCVLVITQACRSGAPAQEELKSEVNVSLDGFVAELVARRPADLDAYAERLRAYLEAHPAFYGSAAALLDTTGNITAIPYVRRTSDGFDARDLSLPRYNYDIAEQEWIALPLAANASVWTSPYFDAGGGEIWMITRSVLARDADGIFAIVTTDLPVDAPE